MRLRIILVHVAIAYALISPVVLGAQHADVIRGRVTTDSGAAIDSAAIIVTRAPDRATFRGIADRQGQYQIIIPNGTGDYLVYMSAIGRQAFRKRLLRVGTDTVFTLDAKLVSAVQQLAAVAVRAATPKPQRGSGFLATDPGAAEKVVDGVTSAIPPDQIGDLNAAAATVPGLSVTPAGPSAFGLGASANSTTLNGASFAGGDVPRAARTTTRVATSTYDPSRGWFSGATTNVDLAGGNLLTSERASFTLDAPPAQYTDPVSARLGQRYTNLRLNFGADGPLTANDRLFYSYGAQYAHRTAGIATLADASSDLLRYAGVSHDSVSRLLQIARDAGIPIGGAAPSLTTDDASFIARFDHAPFDWTTTPPTPSPQTLALTMYGKWTRATSLSLGPTATPDHGGENWRALGMMQGLYSRYWGKDYLSEVRSTLTHSRSQSTPMLAEPDGHVLVGSSFPDGPGGFSTLQFGGNGFFANSARQTTWETIAQTQLFAHQKPTHRIKLTADARYDDYTLDAGGNELGTYNFASLGDLAANRPSSFTRTLNTPTRTGGSWNTFLAAGDNWQVTRTLQILYGARLEANAFTNAPAYNAAVDQSFGVRTDETPSTVHVSPRLGFNWVRTVVVGPGGIPVPGGGVGARVSPAGTFVVQPPSAWRGGIGEFRSIVSPLLLNNALVSTGLPNGLTRIACLGADVPTPNWSLYESNPAAIPTECLNGANAAFNDAASSIQVVDKSYEPPRSWRANLARTAQHSSFVYTIDAGYSYGMNQPGARDLNLREAQVFTTSDEGRPVLVPATAIVSSTGAVSSVPARINSAYGRVVSSGSDLHTVSEQVTFTVSPTLSGRLSSWFASLSYTLADTRSELRGFDANTFATPSLKGWARSDLDARHQFLAQASYLKNGFSITAFGRAVSGLPFTPLVGSDVNGDGLPNDRAFIYDPARVSDVAFAQSLRSLRDGASGSTKRCLDSQLGKAAERNSCEGPWTTALNMNLSVTGTRLKLGSRVGLITLNLSNPLGGLDQVLHGSNDLRGWGTPATPDPILYNVRGFDPVSQRFSYAVNPRFGSTSPSSNTLRAPFRVTLDVSLVLGRGVAEQQMERWIEPGRSRPGTKLGVADLKRRYATSVPNPYPGVLQLADSLLLSRDQFEAVQRISADYNKKVDSAWTDLATYLAALPTSFDRAEALQRQEATVGDVWEMTRLHVQENLRTVLTPLQLTLVGGFANIFNTTTTSMRNSRIFAGLRPS
jgi:hypothetical protein